MTIANESRWDGIIQEHELACLRADVCLGSPESFTLDEKRAICEGMDESAAAMEEAMRDDFSALPPVAQAKMLDLLQKADPSNFSWWLEILVGKTPDAAPEE